MWFPLLALVALQDAAPSALPVPGPQDAAPPARDVRAPAREPGDVRLLTLNLWNEATRVEDGFARLVDVVTASDADLVAMSEVRTDDLPARLAAALEARGRPYRARRGPADLALLARRPIAGVEAAGPSVAAFRVVLGDERALVVCVAHLDAGHYAPYLPRGYDPRSWTLRDEDGDGAPDRVLDVEEVLRVNAASGRDEALAAFLAHVKERGLAAGPLVLTGDFNEPSHLDWTPATAGLHDHGGLVVPWPASRALAAAGFVDAWRALHPDPVTHPGTTWPSAVPDEGVRTTFTPLADERDRIDLCYTGGVGARARRAWLVGSRRYPVRGAAARAESACPFALTDLPWFSDHKGLLVDLTLE